MFAVLIFASKLRDYTFRGSGPCSMASTFYSMSAIRTGAACAMALFGRSLYLMAAQ